MKKIYLLFTGVACMVLASCAKAPQEFIITWKNYDDTILATDTVKAGAKPEYKGETPTRESTAEQTFTFSGWTPKVVEAAEDATYVATYKEEARKYAITFLAGEYEGKKGKFSDGKDSKVYYIPYGTIPSDIETPTVDPTPTEEYPFRDWGETLEKVTGEKTYTATYTKDDRHFNIVFDANGGYFDGDKAKTKVTHRIKYNETYKDDIQTNPTRDETAQYKYTFSKWDPEVPTTDTIPTEDVTYTAQWGSELQKYEITYNAGEGYFGKDPSTKTYKETLNYGALPKPNAPTPKDNSDQNKTYVFTGWDSELSEVTCAKTYTAKYEEVDLQILTLSFKPTECGTYFRFMYDGILVSVDWGDGATDQSTEHSYTNEGDYTIVIKGIFNTLHFNNISELYEAKYTGAWETISNFSDCKDLTTVTLDSPTIKKIGGYAFDTCTSLNPIILASSENSINEIENHAFSGSNQLFTTENGVEYININNNKYYLANKYVSSDDNDMIHDGCVIIGDYFTLGHEAQSYTLLSKGKMPDTLRWIGESAFSGAKNPDKIKLSFGDELKGIHRYAFSELKGLISVNIPDSIEYIGEYAISGCFNLEYNTINKNEYLGNFNNKYLILMRHYADKFQCENSCTLIAPQAFNNSGDKITTLNIPARIKYIGIDLFDNNYLKKITVDSNNQHYFSPDGANAIIEKTTKTLVLGCNNTSLPNGIKHIAGYAFNGCPNLTEAIIPDTVQTIDYSSFVGCNYLNEIRIPRLTIYISTYAFNMCRSIKIVSVNIYNQIYDSHNNCNAIINTDDHELIFGTQSTIIPNNVTKIGYGAFEYTSITTLTIPKEVTTIGGWAFYDCENLTKIILPSTLESIGNSAFANCLKLKNIVIPISVKEMGSNVFDHNITDGKPTIFVYCETASKPNNWSDVWDLVDQTHNLFLDKLGAVEWGYTPSNVI